MTLVVDASVVVGWFVDEIASTESRALLVADVELLAPDLLFAEVANALWSLARRGRIRAEHVRLAVARMLTLLPDAIPSRDLVVVASSIASDVDHPVYDCFYLAAAADRDATLVTNDRRLLTKVAGTPWGARGRPLVDAPAA